MCAVKQHILFHSVQIISILVDISQIVEHLATETVRTVMAKNLLPHPMKRAVAHVAPMGLQKCAQELNTLSDIDNNRLPAIDSKIQMTFQKIRQRTLQASQPVAIG